MKPTGYSIPSKQKHPPLSNMANLNKVILAGNMTRDIEVTYTPKGTAVGGFGLAVNRRVPDGNGGYSDEATFVDVTAWQKTAELIQEYCGKGSSILVEGRLQMDTWEDKQSGQKRSKLKVVAENVQFLSRKSDEGQGNQPAPRQQSRSRQPEPEDDDSEIPF
jgi:single-strand DNA-binding protein